MLYASVPVGYSFSLLDYIPAQDQATVSGVNVIVRVQAMYDSNVGPSCYLYTDGVYVAPVGFDTTSEKEWRDGSVSLTVSPGIHSFTYSCVLGYIAGADAILLSYW